MLRELNHKAQENLITNEEERLSPEHVKTTRQEIANKARNT